MKSGKPQIHNLPINDVTTLGAYAFELQQEAEARGETLPLPARLHIGEPSFRTPEHIRHAAIEALQTETMTYGPAAGWPWLRELIAAKIERVNGYHVRPAASCHCYGRYWSNSGSIDGNRRRRR